MMTAADGASEFYNIDSNEARYEDENEAIEQDRRLRDAYMGHRNYYLIDNNCKSFKEKINNAK